MKKLLMFLIISLLSMNACYALQITSDDHGPQMVSEPQLRVGSDAPRVATTAPDFQRRAIGGPTGRVQIISTIESLYTPAGDEQTIQLNNIARQLKTVSISVVSANLPFVLETFRAKHKINYINLLSTFNDYTFGQKYGVLVMKGELAGILARSIFVVDKHGRIVYKEISENIDEMPNLREAVKMAQNMERQQ